MGDNPIQERSGACDASAVLPAGSNGVAKTEIRRKDQADCLFGQEFARPVARGVIENQKLIHPQLAIMIEKEHLVPHDRVEVHFRVTKAPTFNPDVV